MAKKDDRNDWGVMELAREKPFAATAVAAGAAAAGLFLWSKRSQISDQLNGLSEQIGQWTEGMRGGGMSEMDDTAALTTSGTTSTRSRRSSSRRGTTSSTSGRRRVQSAPTNPE